MTFEVHRFTDPEAFLLHTREFLFAREAQHTLPLSVIARLSRSTAAERDGALLATVERAGDVVLAAVRMPPLNLGLTTTDVPSSIETLVDDLCARPQSLPGVHGPAEVSRQFAEAWTTRTSAAHEVRMRMRLFSCAGPEPPDGVPGRFRHATSEDREQMIEWLHAFEQEAVPHEVRTRQEQAEAVDRLLAAPEPRMHLWEDGSRPVSMAVNTINPPTSPRIGGVYTPPELRGHGYAGACVAALTRHLLDTGHRQVLLFTDLDNPVSNRVYTRIGYRPLGDFTDHTFR